MKLGLEEVNYLPNSSLLVSDRVPADGSTTSHTQKTLINFVLAPSTGLWNTIVSSHGHKQLMKLSLLNVLPSYYKTLTL